MAETRAAEAMRELELEAEAWDKVAAEAREQAARARAEAAEARAMAARTRLAADAKVCNRARCTFRVPPPYA